MFNQFVIITQYVGHYLKFQKKTYATISTNIKFLIMKIAQTVTINMLGMTFAIDYYQRLIKMQILIARIY
ncbi:Uncharacterised protein [Mycobacteroides abscessus subsp. abscessus]|nr:Uncharacterised protein [Mycobacteroides abscessus subsp. abscessus]